MFFRQFYLQGLGHASYLVGSEETGEALLFDPQRDVAGYFAEARMQGLRVRHALDSHGHNDYLSGLTEVGERGEVELLASAAADVGFDHRPLRDGERFDLGEVGFEVLHTSGHTPEHISLLVYDGQASADEPALLLSGGALLVGDLARPTSSAVRMRRRLRRRSSAPPSRPRSSSWRTTSRCSPPMSPGRCALREPPASTPAAVKGLVQQGAVVLDTRPAEAFGGGHVPGALNVGQGAAFPTWAGTVLDEGAAIVLVLDSPADLWPVTWDLLRIGYDLPVGWLAGGMMAWRTAALDVDGLPQITVHELKRRLADGQVDLLDVRQPGEWGAGSRGRRHLSDGRRAARGGWATCPGPGGRWPWRAARATGPRWRTASSSPGPTSR